MGHADARTPRRRGDQGRAPARGESGRASQPSVLDPDGRSVGATFLRTNLNKRSVGIDLADGAAALPRPGPALRRVGRELQGRGPRPLRPRLRRRGRPAPADHLRFGLGLRHHGPSPYREWPAYAAVVEAMSGIYDWSRPPDATARWPTRSAVWATSARRMFAVIGILAALWQRAQTGGASTSTSPCSTPWSPSPTWSRTLVPGPAPARPRRHRYHPRSRPPTAIRHAGQPGAPVRHAWPSWSGMPGVAGRPALRDPPGLGATTSRTVIRPAVEGWMSTGTEARHLPGAGRRRHPRRAQQHRRRRPRRPPPAGPLDAVGVRAGGRRPCVVPGNPIELSDMSAEGPDRRGPWLGEHTDAVLQDLLGLHRRHRRPPRPRRHRLTPHLPSTSSQTMRISRCLARAERALVFWHAVERIVWVPVRKRCASRVLLARVERMVCG